MASAELLPWQWALIGVAIGLAVIAFLSWLGSPKSMNLKNKLVVITGGSSGIGRAVAKEALLRGAHVALIARKQTLLEEAARELNAGKKTPGQLVTIHSADICSEEACIAAFRQASEQHGKPVDVVINSAGIVVPKRLEETSSEEFLNTYKVNVFGARNAVLGALRVFHPAGGRIVFISSQAGQTGVYGYTSYSPSKFALSGFAQALQQELYTRNITVSLCYPPDTDTPMLAEENKLKHRITRMLTESTAMVQPEVVAQGVLNGVEAGMPFIPVGFDGWMLTQLTAGMAPAGSLISALIQIFTMGLWRLVALLYLQYFYWVIGRNDKQPAGYAGAAASGGAAAAGSSPASAGAAKSAASLTQPLVDAEHKRR